MRRPLLLGLLVGAVAVIAIAIVAGVLIAQALDRQDALAGRAEAEEVLRDAVAEAEATADEAGEVLALAGDPLVPVESVTAVETGRDAVTATAGEAETALAVDLDALETEEVRATVGDLRDLGTALDDDRTDLDAVFAELTAAVVAEAPAVDAANLDAENAPRIAFRGAVTDLGSAVGDQVAEGIQAYLTAAHALEASAAAELAEKAGPLFEARMAVQAFARGMAGDVMLEFDWFPTVNGYGQNGSYGGTSYWDTADGGQATITLSDSVAQQWPRAGVQALVVHEVGHAVLSRRECHTLYFDSELYPGEEESWATAWAIGLGYTADGSGESIYGRPSDALIALSQQCR